jgi:PAS domain S-box-containing protein
VPGVVRYVGALAAVAVATAAQVLLHLPATDPFPYDTVLLALVLVAWFGGVYPALLVAVGGGLSTDYFLLRPRHSFAVHGGRELAGVAFYVGVAIGIVFLAAAIKSARRRAESAVDDLRDQVAVIDQAYDAVIVWDWNGPITFWNHGAARLYGVSRAEAVGQVSRELLATRVTGGFESVLETLERTGLWEGELERKAPDGRELVVQSRMTLVAGTRGAHVLEANRDLTERRLSQLALREAHDLLEARVRERAEKLTQANEALQVSEARFRLLVESVSDHAIFMLDAAGLIQTWNKGAERISGYQADELIGQHYGVFFSAEDRESGKPQKELDRAVNEGHADIAGWRVRKNGSRFWATGAAAVLRDEQGNTKGFATIARDSTAARRTDDLVRAVLDNTLDAIISIDAHGTISLFNQAAEATFGHQQSEVVGQNVNVLMPEPERSEPGGYFVGNRTIIGSAREVRGLRKDGSTFPMDLAVTEFEFDQEQYFVAIVRDSSVAKSRDERLRESQRLAAVGQLAGGVAHDFNNLLLVIRGYSAMILKRPLDEQAHAELTRIDEAAERAADLTRQLLAFSRQQILRPELVDANAVVEETVRLLGPELGEDIDLVSELDANLPPVLVDRAQLGQVITNLALNARDAMAAGGALTIRTASVELDEPEVSPQIDAVPGRFVRLQVTDTGSGMDAETRERIFEPFFSTKSGGSGLGLATVYGIVTQSGGQISLSTAPGRGTTFELYFPAAAGAGPIRPAPGEVTGLEGDETILLVEDEGPVRELVMELLESHGYTVLAAATPAEALEISGREQGRLDLLLTDVVMPGMNGRELAEQLLAKEPGLRVLFTSGYPADQLIRHGIAEAVAAFIEKPYLPDELALAVRQALDSPGR